MSDILEGCFRRSPADDDICRPQRTERRGQLRHSGAHRIDNRWPCSLRIPEKRSVGVSSVGAAIR